MGQRRPIFFSLRTEENTESAKTEDDTHPVPPPESLTAEQIRYALSQWLQALRFGPSAARIVLEDAATVIRFHRHHNTCAKDCHTQTKRRELGKLGIDVDEIRTCLGSNFALYC
jgi:hypothetical protein